MKDLIPSRFQLNDGVSILEIHEAQRQNKFVIPSDYVYFLLHTNGLIINEGLQITIDKQNPIVRIDDLVDLEWLVKEFIYDHEEGADAIYRDKFLKIASTYGQDRVLIGYSNEVVNQIYLFDYDDDQLVKICDSIFEFLDVHLI